jgi:hypothetical protein
MRNYNYSYIIMNFLKTIINYCFDLLSFYAIIWNNSDLLGSCQ